jgi:glycosyltransferase involved in cell wall biosynthesis
VEPLKREDLTGTDVFHSPCFPLPDVTRRVPGLKRVLTVYDLIPIRYPQYCGPNAPARIRAIHDCLDPADGVICHSVATKKDLMAYRGDIPAERVSVIPLAAEECFKPASVEAVRTVRKRYGLPEGPYVLTVSRIEPRKNIDLVVRAYRRLVEQQNSKDLSLVLCGSSERDRSKLDEAIRECGPVAPRIIQIGHVPDDDLAPLYSGALAFVYPSFCEGFGLPPLEAMQCGTPVVASNATSLPEVVGDAGILLDPADEDGLCRAVLDLYRNEGLRRDMSRKSLARAGRFHWNRTVQDTVAAYEKVMRS